MIKTNGAILKKEPKYKKFNTFCHEGLSTGCGDSGSGWIELLQAKENLRTVWKFIQPRMDPYPHTLAPGAPVLTPRVGFAVIHDSPIFTTFTSASFRTSNTHRIFRPRVKGWQGMKEMGWMAQRRASSRWDWWIGIKVDWVNNWVDC